MEDAVDALKMSASVFAFAIALSIVFSMFSLAREVSDIVIAHTDREYYADWTGAQDTDRNRTVGVETVIPTLYRYYKEKFSVDMVGGSKDEKFDQEIEIGVSNNLNYTSTETYRSKFGDYYKESSGVISIPWLGSSATTGTDLNVDIQRRVDLYISGKTGSINSVSVNRYGYGRGLKWDATYTESFRQEYNGVNKEYSDGSVIDIIKGTTKLYITYRKN